MDYLVNLRTPGSLAACRLENTDWFFERVLTGYLFYGGFDELDMDEIEEEVRYFSRDPNNPDVFKDDLDTVMQVVMDFEAVPENTDTLSFMENGALVQDVNLVNKNESTWCFKVTV